MGIYWLLRKPERITVGQMGRDIDIVMKRSKDGGETWGSQYRLFGMMDPNTCAYPTPVLEKNSGRIYLFACHNLGVDLVHDVTSGKSVGRRSIFVMHSDDQGATWTAPIDQTSSS